jgi:hypothetical protein
MTAIIRSVAPNELTFNDNIFTAGAEPLVTIKRSVPDIDYVAEYGNRVWGARDNEVIASKLGDFKNWNVFDGLSTDSYATKVGSEGAFTGILSTPTHLALSKEMCIHKLWGAKPENFEVGPAVQCVGVMSGHSNHKSICNVNGTVYYLGANGYIMAYSGGMPEIASLKLGKKYSIAVGGGDGRKYYCNLSDNPDDPLSYQTFVLDTLQNRWYPDTTDKILSFTFTTGNMYQYTYEKPDTRHIDGFFPNPDPSANHEVIYWEFETGPLYETIGEKQGNSEINLLIDMSDGSSYVAYKKLDNNFWQWAAQGWANEFNKTTGLQRRTISIPIEDCQSFRLRIGGYGRAVIHGLERVFYIGGRG